VNKGKVKISKGTKRIVIYDKDNTGMGLYVHCHLEEYKRKHWWSFKRSWCVTSGIGTNSDDRDKYIQELLTEWIKIYPNIEIINTTLRIKFSPELQTRKVLFEKVGKPKKKKPVKVKRVICVDDGTLARYECKYNDGTTEITAGRLYRAKEHHSNEERLEFFEKFLYVKNNFGKVEVYPMRLFKEIDV
jgi:hypothetical protein